MVDMPGSTITAGSAGDAVSWSGQTLSTVHGPAWRLLIVGAGQISTYLAQMAQALDYQVYVCDPHSAVVVLTHDPKLDDMMLLEALKSPAFPPATA